MPTFGSLFSGVGGFDLGLERAGWTCAFQCEIDPFCQRVLARHWPHVARWADVRERKSDGHESLDLGSDPLTLSPRVEQPQRIDLLCGGFPCQDLSVAGKRAGLAGERSGLFWEFLRVARELSPRWLLLENVPGLLSSRGGRDFGALLEGLEDSGYGWAYRVLDSQHFGVAQRRRRVFIVGHRGGPCPPSVLFEPASRQGHPAPGREAGARVAASLVGGVDGTRSHGKPSGSDRRKLVIAHPVVGTSYKDHDDDTDTLLVSFNPQTGGDMRLAVSEKPNLHAGQVPALFATLNSGRNSGGFRTEPGEHLVSHTLKAEGADASEDGTGRGVPMVVDEPFTLASRGRGDSHQLEYRQDGTANALLTPNGGRGGIGVGAFASASSVRRLTPTECEVLQGFPPGWTCLCGVEPYMTETCRCPDSARYRAMGNAVTVPVIEWIGQRLFRAAV